MATRKPDQSDGVEIYSTRFLSNMLWPRSRERAGKSEPIVHRSTGTAQPPVCYAAWSDYRALEARAAQAVALLTELQGALTEAQQLLSASPTLIDHEDALRARLALQSGLTRVAAYAQASTDPAST
jgi:hypothetical protein